MSLILKPDNNYPEIYSFKNSKIRFVLDLHYASRIISFSKLSSNFRFKHYKRVYNFGSISKKLDIPLSFNQMDLVDLLLPNSLTGTSFEMKNCYDLGIMIEVLEHLVEPKEQLKSIHEVLSEEAFLLITTPFLAREHGAPDDYYRWTESGICNLLNQSGFKIVNIVKRGNIVSVIASFSNYFFYNLLVSRFFLIAVVFFPIFIFLYLIGWISLWLSLQNKINKTYLGLTVLAQRKS